MDLDVTAKALSLNGNSNTKQVPLSSIAALDEYVLRNWLENFVVTTNDCTHLDLLCKRPYTLHLHINSPLLTRYNRMNRKCGPKSAISIEKFLKMDDAVRVSELCRRANVFVENFDCNDINEYLDSLLEKLGPMSSERVRPSWTSYFMKLSDLAAQRSNCMKRRVGCVLVKGNVVVSTGYNGTPRGMPNCNEGGCTRCNEGHGSGASLATCLCLHAEENAIIEAGRARTVGCTLFCNTCPCLTCSVKIVQSGIKNVVYSQSYFMDEKSKHILQQGGVTVEQYIAIEDRL